MSPIHAAVHKPEAHSKKTIFLVGLFLFVAIAGLFYVKWWPYYHKVILAFTTSSIGTSIIGEGDLPAPSWESAWSYATAYFAAVWKAAVLGILLGSLIQVLIPSAWLLKVLGKTSFGSTAAGGAASLPGMMCSCCAAPIAIGMRKRKASVGASLAFWIGNPAINPAVLIFMTFVLSWKFTLLRLAAGLLLTFGVSYFANRFAKEAEGEEMEGLLEDAEPEKGSFLSRWMKSMGSMVLYVVPAYLLSVLLLGAARVWLFPNISGAAADGILIILLFAVTGMLFVIPTAAEIPIVQSMMAFGLGAGPAAALLVTLPAISLPSILMVARSFPKKVILFVMASVTAVGTISGIIGMYLF
ncbi:permease [Peribacillus sp. SCS-26]|uniref:permease n=1 Tax=Paraperibacillus marinus TaxID=3115295 RepID=UPI003905AF53